MTAPAHIVLAQQRCRAELVLAPARANRRKYLQALAAAHDIELPTIAVDDEAAVQRAAHLLANAGAPIDWECITVPTADQWLAGQTIVHPPTVRTHR